ncbi:hypothetical protein [Dechloromonas sp. HYN0024]|jgi:hypothetical protein|uniref:hypothetical protein n=1 Tax=Dechloromonas sp. HYN0024 TaxID=2231055 RepID=UPI0019677A9C|nr:hypothetical protein [Dechloromonas sp. HYN0024]
MAGDQWQGGTRKAELYGLRDGDAAWRKSAGAQAKAGFDRFRRKAPSMLKSVYLFLLLNS